MTFSRIEEMENHGVAKQDIMKLKNAGFHTIESVMYCAVFVGDFSFKCRLLMQH